LDPEALAEAVLRCDGDDSTLAVPLDELYALDAEDDVLVAEVRVEDCTGVLDCCFTAKTPPPVPVEDVFFADPDVLGLPDWKTLSFSLSCAC
jgi:hypothetical protein